MNISVVNGIRSIALIGAALLFSHSAVMSATWNSTNAGNWSDTTATGWNGAYPNAIGDSAIFSQVNWTTAKTFNLDVNATVGALTLAATGAGITNAPSLSSTNLSSLTFDAGGSGPATLSWAGSTALSATPSTISVALTLNDDLMAIGRTGLKISGNITGVGKKLTVNSDPVGSASNYSDQLWLTGNNTGLTGGIIVNASSSVRFESLAAMGGGGNGSVLLAAGSTGLLGFNPTNATAINAAIAMLDTRSAGMFGLGVPSGGSFAASAYAIDLSGITNIRLGTFDTNYFLNVGTSLTFDFANNGNKYAIGGASYAGTAALIVNAANIFSDNHSLDVLPQTVDIVAGQNYTGSTVLSPNQAGTFTGAVAGINLAGNGTILDTSDITLNLNTTFTINNGTIPGIVTTPVNLSDRVNDAATIEVNGGKISYVGFATGNSTETLGAITVGSGYSSFTTTYGGGNTAVVTAASLSRSAGQGSMLVNGLGLGKDSASAASVSRILLNSAPTLVGTTAATASGINSAVKDTKIIPFLVGASTPTSGGVGSAGTANTFVTYNATTGLRPLNPTDEFTNNSIVAGNNTYITAATTAGSSAAINSLVVNGGNLAISNGQTLTVSSGAVLFASANSITTPSNGILNFGSNEAIITDVGGATISAIISGTAGLTKSGGSTLTLNGANTYTGTTTVSAGTLATGGANKIQDSSAMAVAIGATFQLGGGETVGSISGAGNYNLNAFTLTAGGDNTNTIAGGVISGVGSSLIKAGTGTLTLSGANTYTGSTTVSVGTLLVNGNQASATGAIGVSNGAILGGSGIIGGAVTVNSGGMLAPGSSLAGNLTINNNITVASGGGLSMKINGSISGTQYEQVTMTNASSVFSLTGSNNLVLSVDYVPAIGTLFFLVDNQGSSSINGIFETLNGTVVDMSQGALLTVGLQQFLIGYTGDVVGGTFTGGNDLVLQAVPEPRAWMLLAVAGIFFVVYSTSRRRIV